MPGRLQHLLMPRWWLRRCFPPATLAAITRAIRDAEQQHSGEIVFAVETSLALRRLRDPGAGAQRARELFAQLGVWDTRRNNGVLIYVLLAGREIHIVADCGLDGQVSSEEWAAACRLMEAHYREGRFGPGSLAGIAAVSALVGRHFPADPGERNELPDEPVLIG